ncbi:MAG: hypothetical protein JWM34_476 [Ilumatobacteraceae bacterium]|nr:hypothetical protein [Ilumatobacteraceae bacterium]
MAGRDGSRNAPSRPREDAWIIELRFPKPLSMADEGWLCRTVEFAASGIGCDLTIWRGDDTMSSYCVLVRHSSVSVEDVANALIGYIDQPKKMGAIVSFGDGPLRASLNSSESAQIDLLKSLHPSLGAYHDIIFGKMGDEQQPNLPNGHDVDKRIAGTWSEVWTPWDGNVPSAELLAPEIRKQLLEPSDDIPDAQVLSMARMVIYQQAMSRMSSLLDREVADARAQRLSWRLIGRATGMTLQSAQQRWNLTTRQRRAEAIRRRRIDPFQILEESSQARVADESGVS